MRALTLLVLLLGCAIAHPTEPDVALGERFELRVGEPATVDDGGLTLTLERVSEDSRCPLNVDCVWAGDAVVVIAARTNAATADLELHTHPSRPVAADVAGYRIEMLSLAPARETEAAIEPEAYFATMVVTRN
jgi:hypothetical protein